MTKGHSKGKRATWVWNEILGLVLHNVRLEGCSSVVRGTPVDNLKNQEGNVGNQEGDGDGVKSGAREPFLLEILSQEDEHELGV